MSKKSVLDSLRVTSPCTEDWDRMTGNAKVRFCSHCAKDVNNISEMTPKEAVRLARKSNGNICIRYKVDPFTKAPVFASRLHQLTRSPIAATGVMAASLALSTAAFAQGGTSLSLQSPVESSYVLDKAVPDETQQKANDPTAFGSISGTLQDPNGAVVPSIVVKLINEKGEQVRTATSDAAGVYLINDVPAGLYSIKVDPIAGFGAVEVSSISISPGKENVSNLFLPIDPAMVEVTVGGSMVSIVEYLNPLTIAVANEDIDEVRDLIADGADVNAKEENKTTALFAAVESGNTAIVELLLNSGAKVNARDENKQTPLMQLDEDADIHLAELLIINGAKINLTDKEGNTALILAADNDVRIEVLRALIDAGADVNLTNNEGQSALMNAASDENIESVRMLLNAGAKVNLKNKDDETAWDLTSEEAIEELLVSHGAIVSEDEIEDSSDDPADD